MKIFSVDFFKDEFFVTFILNWSTVSWFENDIKIFTRTESTSLEKVFCI